MTTQAQVERNKATIRRLFDEVINTGRLDLCPRYLADDRIDHQDYGLPPGAANGHAGFQRVLGEFLKAFPDLHLEIEFMIGEGDHLMAMVTTTGTHKGAFNGLPPTGRSFRVNSSDIFRFDEQGKVSDHWGVFDTFGMLAQLGLVGDVESAEAA